MNLGLFLPGNFSDYVFDKIYIRNTWHNRGGRPGENLTPVDVVKFTAAYAMFLKKNIKNSKLKVVVGRDARVSGDMLNSLVTSTLNAMGIDVIDAGLSTTPTVEIAVVESGANGGIILTASHNPGQWNALKLLDEHGEFLSQMAGEEILVIAENEQFHFSPYNELGKTVFEHGFIDLHIQKKLLAFQWLMLLLFVMQVLLLQ